MNSASGAPLQGSVIIVGAGIAGIQAKIIWIFMAMVSIPIGISISGNQHLGTAIIQVAGCALAVISITTGITVYRRGYNAAKFYILGFGAYMISLLLIIMAALLGLTSEFVFNHGLEIG